MDTQHRVCHVLPPRLKLHTTGVRMNGQNVTPRLTFKVYRSVTVTLAFLEQVGEYGQAVPISIPGKPMFLC